MTLAISELLQTAAVAVVAYVLITALALFCKAESATWEKPDAGSAP